MKAIFSDARVARNRCSVLTNPDYFGPLIEPLQTTLDGVYFSKPTQ